MITISVVNQKGGVAKTTTSFNVAAILANKGFRTLLIDNDEQASLTLSAAFDPASLDKTITNVYRGECPLKEVIIETGMENLKLAPSDIGLATLDYSSFASPNADGMEILKKELNKVKNDFDFVVIDNPPSLSFGVLCSLTCADYALIPCKPSRLSTYALDDLFKTLETVRKKNKKLKVLGVVATMYRRRITQHEQELQMLKENYNLIGTIMESAEAEKAIEEGVPVVVFRKNSKVSKQYLECTENILRIMGVEDNAEQTD